MSTKSKLLSIAVISIILILPHTKWIPNFLYSLPILFVVWLTLRHQKLRFKDIGFNLTRISLKSLLIGGLVAIATLSFMQLVFFPLVHHFITFDAPKVELYDFLRANPWQFAFILIMGWIIGGVYEEIVFHGFIFSQIETMIPGKFSTPISFIVTSLLFGFYHVQLGIDGMINAHIVGAVYLLLFLKFKRNLWYSIICHGMYNSIVISLIYLGYL